MSYSRRTISSAVLWLLVSALPGCQSETEPILDEGRVIVNNTSVRAEASSSSRTLFRLGEGERVSILEKSGTWYRVNDSQGFEGWMDESTLLRDSTFTQMQQMLAEAASVPVQNTVTTEDEVNLRLAPGRDSAIIRRLRRNVSLEVLDRATTPRPDSDATDIWFKVRPGPDEIGWVFAQLVEFRTPEELLPFTEGRIYAAVETLNEVVDPEDGPVHWYVVGERRPGAPPELAFDGIRVFTWNLERHRYETALRLRDLQGAYPIEITPDGGFRFRVLDSDGNTSTRSFVMRGSVPREVRAD